jgi:IS5 family transposase
LHKKIIKKCLAIAKKEQLSVRQTYTRTLKKLGVDQRFRNHPRNKSKAKKADKKVRTITGRLVCELERNLKPDSIYLTDIELFKWVLAQKRTSKNKIYSLYEPETLCISKGKEHKKFEFGNKASFVYTQNTGVIVGAMGFRNEFDGHTLEPALEQTERLVGKAPKKAAVDRGYRGRKQIGETQIQLPKPFNDKTQTKCQQKKLKEAHKKRAAIEPVIGHLKTDHLLGRNFYKVTVGDNINIMLAAAAFNFKRMMNKWKLSYCQFFQELYSLLELMIYKIFWLKRAF